MLFTLAASPSLLIPFSHILSRNWDGFKIRIILYIQNTVHNIKEMKNMMKTSKSELKDRKEFSLYTPCKPHKKSKDSISMWCDHWCDAWSNG